MLSADFSAETVCTNRYIRLSLEWPEVDPSPLAYVPYDYVIERRENSTAPFVAIDTIFMNGTYATHYDYDDETSTDHIYTYRIRYVYRGELSQPAFVSGGTQLNAPDNLRTESSGDSVVSLTWNDKSQIETAYVLRKSPISYGKSWVFVDTLAANTTSYIDKDSLVSGSYRYEVRAINEYNTSVGVLDTIVVQNTEPTDSLIDEGVDPVTDLAKAYGPEESYVYPNPGTGLFYLKSNVTVTSSLYLYDAQGQLQRTIKDGTKTIDLTDLPNGLYLLRFDTNRNLKSRKIVKQ